MIDRNDIVNKKYGELTVISLSHEKKGKIYYNCTCSCGKKSIVFRHYLFSGHTTSCGCKRNGVSDRLIDLMGKVFNHWTVKEYKGCFNWECQCSCGTIKLVNTQSLLKGLSKSCGCYQKNNLDNLIGEKFNRLLVQKLKETKKGQRYWECLCDCGNITVVTTGNLNNGHTQSCSCLNKEKLSNLAHLKIGDRNLIDFCEQKNIPYSSCQKTLKRLGEEGFLKYVDGFIFNKKTLPEFIFEKEMDIPFYNKKVLQYRPDFLIAPNTYVNTDGLHWHRENKRDKNYHFELRENFEKQDLRILQFYEDEIYEKFPIVKSIVSNAIGKITNKIYGRKCELKMVDNKEMIDFFEQNHLMGGYRSSRALGLYYNSDLVSCLSYRIYKNKHIEISRFGSKIDTVVVGGFQKLLAMLEDIADHNDIKEIVSFCDLRYATGASYEKAGFKRTGVTLGWNWTKGLSRFNRQYCKATRDMTQKEHASLKKIYKIYDAGQAKYVKNL